jgi:hypothetical protein
MSRQHIGYVTGSPVVVLTVNKIQENIMPIPNLKPMLISSVVFLLGRWEKMVRVHVVDGKVDS